MKTDVIGLIIAVAALLIAAFQLGVWWRERHPRLPRINATMTVTVDDCEECQDWRDPIEITHGQFDEFCRSTNPVSKLFSHVEGHFYGIHTRREQE